MGQREYARHRGVSHTAVAKALRQGRIKATNGKIDSDQADADWARNSQPHGHHASAAAQPQPASSSLGANYAQSRAIRETYMARLAKIDFEAKSGKLMDRAEVQSMFSAFGRAVRSAHENLPGQIAPLLAGLTDLEQIEAIIRRELREIDTSVAKEVLARFGQVAGTEEAA